MRIYLKMPGTKKYHEKRIMLTDNNMSDELTSDAQPPYRPPSHPGRTSALLPASHMERENRRKRNWEGRQGSGGGAGKEWISCPAWQASA